MMKSLADALSTRVAVEWRSRAVDLAPIVIAGVGAGDVVVVKGSNGSRMGPIVGALGALSDRVDSPDRSRNRSLSQD